MEQVVTEVAVGYVHTVAFPGFFIVIHVEDKEAICKKLVEATSGRVGIIEAEGVYFGDAAGEKLVFGT